MSHSGGGVSSTANGGGGGYSGDGDGDGEESEGKRLDEFGDWLDHEQEQLPEEFRLRSER